VSFFIIKKGRPKRLIIVILARRNHNNTYLVGEVYRRGLDGGHQGNQDN
jgi:hypothetical protein